jgi:hypothetical protein
MRRDVGDPEKFPSFAGFAPRSHCLTSTSPFKYSPSGKVTVIG